MGDYLEIGALGLDLGLEPAFCPCLLKVDIPIEKKATKTGSTVFKVFELQKMD